MSMAARISQAVFERSEPAKAIIPLDIQPYFAFIFIAAFSVCTGLTITSKDNKAYLLAFFAALSLSFGAIFVVNSVRVYTG